MLQLFPAGAMAAELSDTVTEETVPEEEYPAETVVPVGAEPTETELPETAVPMEEELPDTIGKELPEEIESTGAKN